METKIYYFSATGNSMYAAKKISEKLGNTDIIPISKNKGENSIIEGNKVGIIFPVYAWGMPRIVEEFIEKIKFKNNPYIFAVATCAGTPGGVLYRFNKIINKKNVKLNIGFAVRQSSYVFMQKNIFRSIMMKISGKPPEKFEERLSGIVAKIKSNQNGKIESSSFIANMCGNLLHGLASKQFKEMDKDFWVTDKCTGCNICMEICPADNIDMLESRPRWNNNCEFCFACLQWCPEEAIEYSNLSTGKKRSHHKEITLDEMLK